MTLLEINLNKQKNLDRLQSHSSTVQNAQPNSRGSMNYNPVISQQTSYRGNSFGDGAGNFPMQFL